VASSSPTASLHNIRAWARDAGLELVQAVPAGELSEEIPRLSAWQQAGYAAGMTYMCRPPELLTNPSRLLDSVRTVLCFAVSYRSDPAPARPSGFGRVARYAWGRDYHEVIPQRLGVMARRMEAEIGEGFQCRYFSDAVPLLERAWASKARLGFIGKNTLLIRPGTGSFTFLAEMLVNVDVEDEAPLIPLPGKCGSCSRCLSACPTGAFRNPYDLDAGRCISYLTIEKRGAHTLAERQAIGEWIFGCDVCQEVCPFNAAPLKRISPKREADPFRAECGSGPILPLPGVLAITTDGDFRARFSGSPILRTKREGLLRNAAAVAVNTGADRMTALLVARAGDDPSPIVRRTALWAAWTLGAREGQNRGLFERCRDVALRDPDSGVREEAAALTAW
jgi:epoxyqueuosine reductase